MRFAGRSLGLLAFLVLTPLSSAADSGPAAELAELKKEGDAAWRDFSAVPTSLERASPSESRSAARYSERNTALARPGAGTGPRAPQCSRST